MLPSQLPDLLLDPIEIVRAATRCWNKTDLIRALRLAEQAGNKERQEYFQKRINEYKPMRTRRDGRA